MEKILTVEESTFPTALARGAPVVHRPIIGGLPIVYFRTHLRSVSHVVMIVKSQWYDRRFVTLLL